MDDAVLRAMARWPNVPAVFGWLRLDARGEWWVKDAASDVFERISNSKIIEFVGRNYAGDADGRWFFQNGPQRVYVELANPFAAPYVLRLNDACDGVLTHNDLVAVPVALAFDDAGHCVLDTDRGIGVLIDRDLAAFVDALVDAAGVPVDPVSLADPSIVSVLSWRGHTLRRAVSGTLVARIKR